MDRELDPLRHDARRGTHRTGTSSAPRSSPADSGELAPLDVPHSGYHLDLEEQLIELSRRERQARAEATALRESQQAKDRFLAMLSHEMRMPLQPVLSSAALLLRDPRLPCDLLDDVRTIQRNVQLEARLIDDLLSLTRIAAGKFALERTRINLHSVILRAVEICRVEAEEKGLSLVSRLDAVHSWVKGDPGRLQQVIWNLLRNAIKFTPPGGEVRIETADTPDGNVIVRVSDTGAGIAPEALPGIFEPFNQADPKAARHLGGLGLGLAVSKLLVERHHGAITAASEGRGRGSIFTVTLSTIQAPPSSATPRGAIPDKPTKHLLRILLVDDDESTCIVMGKLLQSTGHTVRTACGCASAIAHAQAECFDLLLCDLELPDGSGLILLHQLEDAAGESFRSIALTGFGSDEDMEQTRAAGFDSHLTKPITLERLVQEIDRLFP